LSLKLHFCANCRCFFDAAAKVDGILTNSNYPYQFLMENMQIQNNIIDAALQAGIDPSTRIK